MSVPCSPASIQKSLTSEFRSSRQSEHPEAMLKLCCSDGVVEIMLGRVGLVLLGRLVMPLQAHRSEVLRLEKLGPSPRLYLVYCTILNSVPPQLLMSRDISSRPPPRPAVLFLRLVLKAKPYLGYTGRYPSPFLIHPISNPISVRKSLAGGEVQSKVQLSSGLPSILSLPSPSLIASRPSRCVWPGPESRCGVRND